MLRFIWRTDIHVSDHAPRRRSDDWNKALLEKIRWIGSYAKEVGADAVIDGGDFFDVKSPAKNSHKLIQQVIEAHADYPCPVYANVGNHDCVYGDYSFLPQQPLGVLFSAGVFKRLYDEHELRLTSVDGTSVRVCGVPYHGVRYDMGRFNIKKGDEDYLITAAHVLASKTGGNMFEGEDIVKYNDLTQYDTDLWLFGHWHKDQGIADIGDSKKAVNLGSLSRGSLSQDNLDRKPKVALITVSEKGLEVEEVIVPHKPASEAFNVEQKVREEAEEGRIASFVESLKVLSNQSATKLPIKDKIKSLDIGEEVKEKAYLLLEQFDVR